MWNGWLWLLGVMTLCAVWKIIKDRRAAHYAKHVRTLSTKQVKEMAADQAGWNERARHAEALVRYGRRKDEYGDGRPW